MKTELSALVPQIEIKLINYLERDTLLLIFKKKNKKRP